MCMLPTVEEVFAQRKKRRRDAFRRRADDQSRRLPSRDDWQYDVALLDAPAPGPSAPARRGPMLPLPNALCRCEPLCCAEELECEQRGRKVSAFLFC